MNGLSKIAISALSIAVLIGCGGGDNSISSNPEEPKKETVSPKTEFKFSKEYLNAKTLYSVHKEDNGWVIVEVLFTDSKLKIPSTSKSYDYKITSEGYMLIDGATYPYHKAINYKDGVITEIVSKDKSNFRKEDTSYWFEDKAEAQKKLTEENKKLSDTQFKFSKEYLSGKTLYSVSKQECEEEPCANIKWEIEVFKFTNNSMSQYEDEKLELIRKVSYTITKEGYIRYDKGQKDDDSGLRNVKAIEKTKDYISVIWTKEGSEKLNSNKADDEFLYFDLEKAKARLKSENSK